MPGNDGIVSDGVYGEQTETPFKVWRDR